MAAPNESAAQCLVAWGLVVSPFFCSMSNVVTLLSCDTFSDGTAVHIPDPTCQDVSGPTDFTDVVGTQLPCVVFAVYGPFNGACLLPDHGPTIRAQCPATCGMCPSPVNMCELYSSATTVTENGAVFRAMFPSQPGNEDGRSISNSPIFLPHFRLYEVVPLYMCVLPYKYRKIL